MAAKTTKRAKLEVKSEPGEDREKTMAKVALSPTVRNAFIASSFAAHIFGDSYKPSVQNDVEVLKDALAQAEKGDKGFASQILAAQAMSLDAMFTELARRSSMNMGEYLEASERYMRLALKAQANCRSTLEALSKLHQPREQTVKHVHVNEGGQAVVADQFHQHQGEGQNGKTDEQSLANGAAGQSPAMLGQDAQGNGVPIPGGKRADAVPNARGNQSPEPLGAIGMLGSTVEGRLRLRKRLVI